MAQADLGSKRLIGLAPDAWVKWVTDSPDVTATTVLGSEFQWIGRTGDALILASSPEEGEFMVATEVSLRYDGRIPTRMNAYGGLAGEKFDQPVFMVLVNILPPLGDTVIEHKYDKSTLGQRSLQEYKVINLWEVDVDLVFSTPLPTLLPFVPVLKGGGEEKVVRRALDLLRAEPKLNELETLLAFFSTFALKSQVIQRIMRWDMAVLRESPWYNEILDTGVQQGLRQGLQQAVVEAYEERFGAASERLKAAARQVHDTSRLSDLLKKACRAQSAEEFERELGV